MCILSFIFSIRERERERKRGRDGEFHGAIYTPKR